MHCLFFTTSTPHNLMESVQRELNPHFLHGKQVGYRYIMDALSLHFANRARGT